MNASDAALTELVSRGAWIASIIHSKPFVLV